MRAVVCSELAPLDRLTVEERPDLVPGPGHVIIEVEAAGVNFVDALFVQGKYQIKPPLPFTPGGEVAGRVAALGEGVTGLALGDRVLGMCGLGGFASQVALPALSCVPVPDGLSSGQAAALIQSYATMLYAFTRRTYVTEGEWVLVLGAGGGIGLAAIDVARALGARVVAAASSEPKLEAAMAAGAEAVVDYESEDLKTRVREVTGGGADLVVDPVGGDKAEAALRSLRTGGRYVVIGFASGEIPRLPANQVLLNNRTVVGIDWGAWTFQHPAENAELLGDLLERVASGQLRPVEPVAYPLERAAEALADLEGRRITGKVVLVP